MAEKLVLIVEDDADIRESLSAYLEDSGFAVVSAIHGAEALTKLRQSMVRPCAIVLDLMMPVMDGKTFHEEMLREPAWADIPVIVLSAHRDLAKTAGEMNVRAYLTKPPAPPELLRLLHEHCRD